MKRPTDDELILHYYGESPEAEEIDRLLSVSAELRKHYEKLRLVLDSVEVPPVPDPSPYFESRLWHRLEPELKRRPQGLAGWLRPRREWRLVGAMMLLLVLSFAAGRFWPRGDAPPVEASLEQVRERILLVTVAGHLERSEMLLVELANARGNGTYDLTSERRLASELKGSNRLYRQAALQAGQPEIASLLDELERVLLELSHAPEEVLTEDLGDMRLRLDEGDLLFKVRVVGSRLRQEARTPPTEPSRIADDRDTGRDA